ncbi:MAG: alpha/beta hydrolase [Prochloraceae cyanobacterium]|nr:alpha/beta hydrolase [Prochloraceae cyanobacterium]
MKEPILRRLRLGQFSHKRFMEALICLALLYGVLCLFVLLVSERLIFFPQPSSYQDRSAILKLPSGEGITISAVYLPSVPSSYTILYSHGNGEDLGDIQLVLQHLHQIGFSVFAYDYRGYGTSMGRPREQNVYKDIDAAYNYLTQELSIPPSKIIAYGRSVGGGPSVDLASRQPLAGLILESSFTSAFRVAIPIPLFPFDKFRNLSKLKKVNCPVLVIHGTADKVIPLTHGQQLFAAASQPKLSLWVEGANHNDPLFLVAQKQYVGTLRQFAQIIKETQ